MVGFVTNILYHDYKFVTIKDMIYEKLYEWSKYVLHERPCHVLVCLILILGRREYKKIIMRHTKKRGGS